MQSMPTHSALLPTTWAQRALRTFAYPTFVQELGPGTAPSCGIQDAISYRNTIYLPILALHQGRQNRGPEYGRRQAECSGRSAGREAAYNLINRHAAIAVIGCSMDRVEVRPPSLMAFHARAIENWGCPPELYPQALELVLNGRVKVTDFIEKHPLDNINKVFAAAHAGELKRRAVLVPNTA